MGRRARRGAILLAFLLTGCSTTVQVEVVSGGGEAEPIREVAEPENPNTSGDTDADVCAARDAIVSALRASTEDWAAGVADETEGAQCDVDDGGVVQFGPWTSVPCTSDCDDRPMRFLYRREGNQVPSYAAEVVRRGTDFDCTNLGQFLVVPTTTGSE